MKRAGQLLAVLYLVAAGGSLAQAELWHIQTVDSAGYVGGHNSLALDNSGYPCISYRDEGNRNLKYAAWNGTSWEIQTADNSGTNPGWLTSLALDGRDYPRISYYDRAHGNLNCAAWDGSQWRIEVIDSAGNVGYFSSVAVDSTGCAHISYLDISHWLHDSLKYAAWTGSHWAITTVEKSDVAGTSLALDSSGRPHISYGRDYDNKTRGDLKYAAWDGSQWHIETVDSGGTNQRVGIASSLALDAYGFPHISYYWYVHPNYLNGELKYAAWNGSEWASQTVDSTTGVYYYNSLALDSSGYPHISYYDGTNSDLKYAAWNGSSWDIQTVDSAGHVGQR